METTAQQRIDELAAGRDRALDAARALAMVAVAIGHWLVAEPIVTPTGWCFATCWPSCRPPRHLTWVFQVIPLFMVAGFAVGDPVLAAAPGAGRDRRGVGGDGRGGCCGRPCPWWGSGRC
jgi:hypothetical protein